MEYYFKYSMTEDEFADFSAYTSWLAPWQSKTRKVFLFRTFISCAIMMIATIIILDKIDPPRRKSNTTLVILIGVINTIVTALAYYQAPNGIRKRARKLIQDEDNRHIMDENELSINNESIVNTEKKSTVRFGWDSIIRYAVTKDAFYLYINSLQALIIPKRLFKDQQEIQSFDQFVTANVSLTVSFRSM
jgi:hypothetical protein